jgi:vacuolar-type H+-ATPase subunit H
LGVFSLAAEALTRIKEAEAEAGEKTRAAAAQAKDMLAGAGERAEARGRAILAEAEDSRQALMAEVRQKADAFCEALVRESETEVADILSPGADRFEQAVARVTERIVRPDGDR